MSENGRPCQGPLSPHRPQGKRRASTCTTKNGYARRAEDESLTRTRTSRRVCLCGAWTTSGTVLSDRGSRGKMESE